MSAPFTSDIKVRSQDRPTACRGLRWVTDDHSRWWTTSDTGSVRKNCISNELRLWWSLWAHGTEACTELTRDKHASETTILYKKLVVGQHSVSSVMTAVKYDLNIFNSYSRLNMAVDKNSMRRFKIASSRYQACAIGCPVLRGNNACSNTQV